MFGFQRTQIPPEKTHNVNLNISFKSQRVINGHGFISGKANFNKDKIVRVIGFGHLSESSSKIRPSNTSSILANNIHGGEKKVWVRIYGREGLEVRNRMK